MLDLKNVIVDEIIKYPTIIPGYKYKTRFIIRGIDDSLWYLGDITNLHSPGDQVSISLELRPYEFIYDNDSMSPKLFRLRKWIGQL